MHMKQVKLVVFDMAGTTVMDNQDVENAFYEAALATGLITSRRRINAMHGIPKRIVIETLWEESIGRQHPDFQTNVAETFATFKEFLEHRYRSHPVYPTKGTLQIFAWLRSKGIKIALNTGFYREVANIILHRLGWDKGLDENYMNGEVIDLSVTPDETGGKGRPHPDMILKAMEMLGIEDPKQVVKIGDTPVDLMEGNAANCLLSLAVTNGTHTREELLAYDNDGLLNSMADLKNFLSECIASASLEMA